jgi:hypothetical protein
MAERHITDEEVEAVLADYHTRYADRKGNPILIGHPNGRRIKVVVGKDTNPPFIITTGG